MISLSMAMMRGSSGSITWVLLTCFLHEPRIPCMPCNSLRNSLLAPCSKPISVRTSKMMVLVGVWSRRCPMPFERCDREGFEAHRLRMRIRQVGTIGPHRGPEYRGSRRLSLSISTSYILQRVIHFILLFTRTMISPPGRDQ